MDISDFYASYYSNLVIEHGDNHATIGQSKRSQKKRFEKIFQVGDLNGRSILDVGCGLGHFYDFLVSKNWHGDYTGYDICSEVIQIARERHPDEHKRFQLVDILKEPPECRFDYVLANGPLNLPVPGIDNDQLAVRFLKCIYELSRVGIVMTMTSSFTRKPSNDTYYYDPCTILKKVTNFCSNVKIDHTYLPHDFAVFCYKRDLYTD